MKHAGLILALAMTETAFAASNVAVLELVPDASAQDEISIGESRHLTDELRRQAVTALPAGGYSVLTRDNFIALMPRDEKEAERLAESSAIEIGRAIGAEYVSRGTIGKFGRQFTISVELYETAGGKLLSSMVFESGDIDGLLNAVRKEAKPLFQSILSDKKAAKPASIDSGIDAGGSGSIMPLPKWIGIGLAVAGIGFGVYGFSQESEYKKLNRDYLQATDNFDSKWKKAEDAKGRRNLGYMIGSALLAGGITVYFVF